MLQVRTAQTASRTSRGGRQANEDALATSIDAQFACWLVADGLGGHRGGAAAARAAADAAVATAGRLRSTSEDALEEYVAAAHDAVLRAQTLEGYPSMRTTIAIAVADSQELRWAHVGDSRVYLFRRGQLASQTADHSVPYMLVNTGSIAVEEVRQHPDRSRLLKVVGQAEPVRPTVSESLEPLAPGDALLLCTDGWWEHVTEPEMEIDLAKSIDAAAWLDAMVDRILDRAKPGSDNYSAVGVFDAP
jgi:PPM family protein phosphatase